MQLQRFPAKKCLNQNHDRISKEREIYQIHLKKKHVVNENAKQQNFYTINDRTRTRKH